MSKQTEPEAVNQADAETTLNNWEFIGRAPTRDEVVALLGTAELIWGVEVLDFADYVQALPQRKKIKKPHPEKPNILVEEYIEAWTIYMSVAGRQQMLRQAQELHHWRVDYRPEPVTPSGVPGYLSFKDKLVYRVYVDVYELSEDVVSTREGERMRDGHDWRLIGTRSGTAWVPETGGAHAAGSNPFEKCLHPDTRVLTTDLRWVRIGDVRVGDRLIGFDEHVGGGSGAGQKLRDSMVEAVAFQSQPSVRVSTNRGLVTCSRDHQWLVKRRSNGERAWRSAEDLQIGDRIIHYVEPWDVPTSRDAGWLAGFLDGEGHVSNGLLRWTQRPGVVADEVARICEAHDVAVGGKVWEHDSRNSIGRWYVLGGSALSVRALGMFRPTRLMQKARTCWEGARTWSKTKDNYATVLSVEEVGVSPTVAVQTSTRTLIAEGMLSHNCETSALGRALGAWGFGVLPGSGIATVEEMAAIAGNQAFQQRQSQASGGRETRDVLFESTMSTIEQYRQVAGKSDEEMTDLVLQFLVGRLGILRVTDADSKEIKWDVVKDGQLVMLRESLKQGILRLASTSI